MSTAYRRCPHGRLVPAGAILLASIAGIALLLTSSTVFPDGNAPHPIQVTNGDWMARSALQRWPPCPARGQPLVNLPAEAGVAQFVKLPSVHVAFRDPEPMQVGITKDIEVRASASDDPPEDLTADLAGDGPIRVTSFPLPFRVLQPRIIVHLEAAPTAFRILRLQPPDSDSAQGAQAVTVADISSWFWEVTPLDAGPHALLL